MEPLTIEQQLLAAGNLGLVVHVARRLVGAVASVRRLGLDQAISAGQVGLCRAAAAFDRSRGRPFAPLAGVCIARAIRAAAARWCRGGVAVSLDAPAGDDEGPLVDQVAAPAVSDGVEVADLVDQLPTHLQVVVRGRLEGKSASEIAARVGITAAGIRLRERAALNLLRRASGVSYVGQPPSDGL
jgi:DNA-directed RNA polymerase specialized sigma subunit